MRIIYKQVLKIEEVSGHNTSQSVGTDCDKQKKCKLTKQKRTDTTTTEQASPCCCCWWLEQHFIKSKKKK